MKNIEKELSLSKEAKQIKENWLNSFPLGKAKSKDIFVFISDISKMLRLNIDGVTLIVAYLMISYKNILSEELWQQAYDSINDKSFDCWQNSIGIKSKIDELESIIESADPFLVAIR
jgi:hypothetical protein